MTHVHDLEDDNVKYGHGPEAMVRDHIDDNDTAIAGGVEETACDYNQLSDGRVVSSPTVKYNNGVHP